MSVFHLTPSQLQDNLNALPAHNSNEKIMAMIEALQADIRDDPPGLSFTQTTHRHADTHREIFLSYPMLFRTICKKTYRKEVLDILLKAKRDMDAGEKDKKEALEQVIRESVDEVTAIRAKEKKE